MSIRWRRVQTVGALCAGVVAVAAGCESLTGVGGGDGPIEYHAGDLEVVSLESEWTPYPITYLRASVIGVNTSSRPLSVSAPSCILDLEAFRGSGTELDGPPAWRLLARKTWPGTSRIGCLQSADGVLQPGDTLRLETGEISLAEILADSLPVGEYRFRLRPGGTVTEGSAIRHESRVVELGTIELPTSRYPLQLGYYPRDGFIYRVEVEPPAEADGDPVVRLTVTQRAGQALTRALSLRCPVRLFGFETAADRETIPVPSPVWVWPGRVPGCGEETAPLRLEPDGTASFEYRLPRTFFSYGGRSIEDYALMAVIEVDGRPIRFAVDPG